MKVNMKVYVMCLLNILMKTKVDRFYKHEYKKKFKHFQ